MLLTNIQCNLQNKLLILKMKEKKSIFNKGKNQEEVLKELHELKKLDIDWKKGRAFSMVYYLGEKELDLMVQAYKMFMSENALNPGAFKSLKKMEKDLIYTTASLLGDPEIIRGSFTSGGTESILLAVKSARDFALKKNPRIIPEMVIPLSAHPAFDKAGHYFGIKVIHAPLNEQYQLDIKSLENLVNANTVLIVGSAPSYPHGIIDPIEELSQFALKNNLWLHVDACVGGMILPFMEMLGYEVPPFDFRLEGVCSISMDLHKYGYVSKGASIVLYKNKTLKRHQYFVYGGWNGGLYGSAGILGTRSGGNIAAAWALMNHIGIEGYKNIVKTVVETTQSIIKEIHQIPELQIIGNPITTVFAFTSDKVDIYEVADYLSEKGWLLDRQQNPPSLHLTVNYIHKDYIQDFINDLKDAVKKSKQFKFSHVTNSVVKNVTKTMVKVLPEKMVSKITENVTKMTSSGGLPQKTAPMYGMIAQLNNQKDIEEMILDILEGMDE